MLLYKIKSGVVVAHEERYYAIDGSWEKIINRNDLHAYLLNTMTGAKSLSGFGETPLAPIDQQEIWAAGVTYRRSKEARMEESKESGGANFYDKVYDAERPELFFKALPHRVAGPGEAVYIRRDSTWNVPEPELTLFINSQGNVQGYTIGNDMSSRSIEGENPLYLPQAKIYDRSAALGPALLVTETPIAPETMIRMEIRRNDKAVFSDGAPISRMKRSHAELAEYLFRESTFPHGCFLMTGTCVVPGNDFTLQPGDTVEIQIEGIGTLTNTVQYAKA
ncbi:MAG: fumarylacetoacetate hydrolase family protein [Bacteroidetes bacterium]|nr:fumarylacetoacetate hydrolase family protein [Bacteroidota bacterium]